MGSPCTQSFVFQEAAGSESSHVFLGPSSLMPLGRSSPRTARRWCSKEPMLQWLRSCRDMRPEEVTQGTTDRRTQQRLLYEHADRLLQQQMQATGARPTGAGAGKREAGHEREIQARRAQGDDSDASGRSEPKAAGAAQAEGCSGPTSFEGPCKKGGQVQDGCRYLGGLRPLCAERL